MINVAPSILSADFANLEASIKEIENDVSYLHIDVMDGHFVPNITIGAPVIKALRGKTNLIFDTHLMISDPFKYVSDFVKAGSDYITVHVEANDSLKAINKIHELGCKAGISIKPNTMVKDIYAYLDKVELVLVMSVEPGFGGQKFMLSAVDKIRELKELKKTKGYKYLISVDGGINKETAKLVSDAGVELAVAGNYVFKSENKHQAIEDIKCAK